MLVHLWFVTLAVVGVERGLCVRCFSCLSTEPRDACVKLDKSRVPLKTCDMRQVDHTAFYAKQIDSTMGKLYEIDAFHVEPMPPLNCLKQVIQHGNKHYVLRGCQLATSDNLDICVKVKKDNDDLLHTNYCSLCNGDACNGASPKKIFSVAGVVCVTLIVSFFV